MTLFQNMRVRIFFAFLVFSGVFAYLIFHLYQVQIRRHDELLEKGRKRYTATKVTKGNMGEIFDRSGYLLVGNRPYGVIFADPSAIPEKALIPAVNFLSKELALEWEKVYKGLAKKKRTIVKNGEKVTLPVQYFLLKTRLPFDEFERHRQKIENAKLRFIHFRTEYARYYPKGGMLANILGISTIDKGRITPVNGIEKKYASNMRSISGEITYDRTRDGLPIAGGIKKEIHEKDGADHFLTISEPVQAILEEELDKLMAEHKPKAAYAIMANPHTGAIIAMAQRPSFNPNDRSSMSSDCWRNRMAEDVFEPGSVLKPFAVAGALDRKLIQPDTVFDCENGRWFYGGHPLKDDHPIKMASVREIIKKSSNIGTAKIAVLMGKYALDDTLRAFCFGQRSGLQLPLESRGIYWNVKRWSKVSVTRIPIGHGISVSPLQLVRGYCMLANGGHPLKLHLLDRIVTADGKVVRPKREKPGSIYKDPNTHFEIVEMLKRVTEPGGTATHAAIRGYHVAGKTGTAQKIVNKKYSNKKHIATFVGFVPADKPRLVLLVTADEPSGKTSYGGSVSGPYFRNIAERTLRYWNIPPDMSFESYDAYRKHLSKIDWEAKKKLWAEERKEREERRKRRENKYRTPAQNHPVKRSSYRQRDLKSASARKRYYGTYTSMKKNGR